MYYKSNLCNHERLTTGIIPPFILNIDFRRYVFVVLHYVCATCTYTKHAFLDTFDYPKP